MMYSGEIRTSDAYAVIDDLGNWLHDLARHRQLDYDSLALEDGIATVEDIVPPVERWQPINSPTTGIDAPIWMLDE
jgi:hypothetical protein